jgi:hypothetical protein
VKQHFRDDRLQRLRRELYPEVGAAQVAPRLPRVAGRDESSEMHMVSEMLQTMEIAWFAMQLDSYHAHPLNRGWMNLFRRWTNSPTFQQYWPFLRAEYSQDFVRFCERALNMVPTAVIRERLGDAASLAGRFRDVREMDREFLQEWAAEADRLGWLTTGRYLSDAVAGAADFAEPLRLRYPVWMLSLRNGQDWPSNRPCGLVCAVPPFRGAGEDLEFIVWLRGPYRNFGVGRLCIRSIIKDLSDELSPLAPVPRPYRLLAYYPYGSPNQASRLKKALWMNFYFDYGFRSVTDRDDPGALAGVITLARDLRR